MICIVLCCFFQTLCDIFHKYSLPTEVSSFFLAPQALKQRKSVNLLGSRSFAWFVFYSTGAGVITTQLGS